MRAAVWNGPDQPIAVETVEMRLPLADEVLVRVEASGVCHTDLSAVTGQIPLPAGQRFVLGHEGAGVVEAVGSEVRRVKVGDRVIASPAPACGLCSFCSRGKSHLCSSRSEWRETTSAPNGLPAARGFAGLGTFADQMLVGEATVVPVTSELPTAQLALIGCGVITGVGAVVNTAAVRPGDTVAVIGGGGIGLSAVQAARYVGAERIVVVEPSAERRKLALTLGATDVVDPTAGDAVAQVRELTGGGVDFAFEALGSSATIEQAWAMAKRGGTAVIIGMAAADATITLSAADLIRGTKRLEGCYLGSATIMRDFAWIARATERGMLDLDSMITSVIPLEEIGGAFTAMESGQGLRTVVDLTLT